MKKKTLIIIIVAAVLVVAGIITTIIIVSGRNKPVAEVEVTPTPKPKKKVTAPINIIEIEKRPVIALRPVISQGKNLVIELKSLPQAAEEGEYEIEYTMGSATAKAANGKDTKLPDNEASEGVQGFIGELDISKLPVETEKMLGSCSAGGACIYHAGITDGKLTLRFGGATNYALQSTFTYFETGAEKNTTLDEKFSIAGDDLVGVTDFLIVEMMGLPNGLPGKPIMIPDGGKDNGTKPLAYGVYFSGSEPSGELTVSFSDASVSTPAIAAYQNGQWKLLDTLSADSATGSVLSAVAPQAEIYALVEVAQ